MVRGLGLGIGISKWMGLRCPRTPLESPPTSTVCLPFEIECHFKPMRSLFTPVMDVHFDRLYPNASYPPGHTLDIAEMSAEIEKQNAIFDFSDKCEKCEKCDISCSIL